MNINEKFYIIIKKLFMFKPDYLIVVNNEQLDAIGDQIEYKLVLSMPSL